MRQPDEGANERFLYDIFRLISVSQTRISVRIGNITIFGDKRGEGVRISCERQVCQQFVRLLSWRLRYRHALHISSFLRVACEVSIVKDAAHRQVKKISSLAGKFFWVCLTKPKGAVLMKVEPFQTSHRPEAKGIGLLL